jgi:hypothetical protein
VSRDARCWSFENVAKSSVVVLVLVVVLSKVVSVSQGRMLRFDQLTSQMLSSMS